MSINNTQVISKLVLSGRIDNVYLMGESFNDTEIDIASLILANKDIRRSDLPGTEDEITSTVNKLCSCSLQFRGINNTTTTRIISEIEIVNGCVLSTLSPGYMDIIKLSSDKD